MTDEEKTPGLDEQTFGKLVEAAYVLQEHNRDMRAMEESLELHSEQLRQQESALQAQFQVKKQESPDGVPSGDYTLTLAEIVEAQHQIQRRHLTLDPAMAVVAERVARITNASGAAIGLLEGKMVCYRAVIGPAALPLGSEVPLDLAICAASVRTGQVIRSEDVNLEFLFDAEGCLARGIQSLLSVPIYHDGDIVGALELYFDRMRGFAEQDIHTCQLMAGLVTEAIGRDAESSLKKSMASERSTMLAAIEKLKPNLAALADQASTVASPGKKASSSATALACWKCGSPVLPAEQFCGKCGALRTNDVEPSETQSKVASAWQTLQKSEENPEAGPAEPASLPMDVLDFVPTPGNGTNIHGDVHGEGFADHAFDTLSLRAWEEIHPNLEHPVATKAEPATPSWSPSPESHPDAGNVQAPAAALVRLEHGDSSWTSAARARELLEALAATGAPSALARFWHARRGNFYVALALLLVVLVIRFEILSDDPAVGASGHGTAVSGSVNHRKQPAPDADISTFDKLLIALGLAEPPAVPEYKGNPDTQVWVDLHTALYYCPGSDLYGKTPKGRFASQRDAQLDQFEPASRRACE